MPTQPTLPVLSEAELVDFFGEDPGAIRRYRLLQAVLLTGMTQRESAEAYDVSERTVRNILRTYAKGGLESLRSWQIAPRRRRDRRGTTSVQALTAALAEDPQAGGDRLWRRAQELLGDAGKTLSRRTAYRILANLRTEREEDDDPPDSLRGVVRAALPLLPEEPPLALGNSPLAQRLLTTESDPLLRGTILQQALREALDHLRPSGPVSAIDRNWWPYLICTGEYEASQRRADLQDDLALSASTYSRAKRQGIDRISALMPQLVERMIESPTAIVSQSLPRTLDFVGRREEQSYYAWRLQTEGISHLWGLPGSGKTALAAELAAEGQRYGQTILWHTCRPGLESTLPGIVRGLARALGGDELWREIREEQEELDALALLDALRDRLVAYPTVIVIDDIDRADEAEITALIDRMTDLVARRSIRLLLVGRARITALDYPPLPGLSEREARLLWAGAPTIPADQWTVLYVTTHGLPEPLRRAAAAYRRAGDLARPVDWVEVISAWVDERIWSRLDEEEQRLLVAIHALVDRPWADRLNLVCEAMAVPMKIFERLLAQNLLTISGGSIVPFEALRFNATPRRREDSDLREQLDALVALPDAIDFPDMSAPPEARDLLEGIGLGAASGLDLLTRLRYALEHSAAYLQQQPDDAQARRLAAELEALQAALPDPLGPRRLPAPTVFKAPLAA